MQYCCRSACQHSKWYDNQYTSWRLQEISSQDVFSNWFETGPWTQRNPEWIYKHVGILTMEFVKGKNIPRTNRPSNGPPNDPTILKVSWTRIPSKRGLKYARPMAINPKSRPGTYRTQFEIQCLWLVFMYHMQRGVVILILTVWLWYTFSYFKVPQI